MILPVKMSLIWKNIKNIPQILSDIQVKGIKFKMLFYYILLYDIWEKENNEII